MVCSICVPTGPKDAPVCRTCGRALAVLPTPLAVPPVAPTLLLDPLPSPSPAGWESRTPRWMQQGLGRWRADGQPRMLAFLRQAQAERTGLLAGGVVLLVCLAVTVVGWTPLSWPPIWINQIVTVVTPGSCSGLFARGSLFTLCAGTLGIISMSGSFIALGLLLFFRQQLTQLVQRLMARMPQEVGFLAAPVIATLVFTMTWAGNAFHFPNRNGIVSDGLFPSVVGLLTYITIRYGPGLMERLAALMVRRDQLSPKVRLGLVIAIMWLISILLEGKVRFPVRDQLLVIIGVIVGYLALAPSKGNLGAGLQEALRGIPQAGVRAAGRKEGAKI